MLTSGDLINLELGNPVGSEAGLRRLAVVVTSQTILDVGPNVVQAVPLTRTIRDSGAEVTLQPDPQNGLDAPSAAQCQHIRSVATGRISHIAGNVGPSTLQQIREIIALIIDA